MINFGKHLNKKRHAIIKYGWFIATQGNESTYLFKIAKRIPFKLLFWEELDGINAIQAKKRIEYRIDNKSYQDPDEKYELYDKLYYDDIQSDDKEQFYRFMTLKDTLKKL